MGLRVYNTNNNNKQITPKPTKVVLGARTNPHHAAADGLLHILKEIAVTDRAKLFSKDANGWTPLHEAARAGRTHVIQYLLDEGAQINERTNDGRGASPLWWAERNQRHDSVELLKKHGGVSLAPNESVPPPKIPDPPKDNDDTTDETTEPEPKPKPFQTEHKNADQE
jgi:ankyrin repeat protein